MRKAPPFVLSIAGSDSGGGAGIQADQRVIVAVGCHALTAVTAVTAQDTRGVQAWEPVSPSLISRQVSSALEGFPVSCAKTGLLPGAASVRAASRILAGYPRVPVVVDPVIASTSGSRFLDAAGVRSLLSDLLPLAVVATPNWAEAEALSGLRVGSYAEAERAGAEITRRSGCAVLVKGGHSGRTQVRDCLVTPDGAVRWWVHARIRTRNTHGTGCSLSAAIAAWLARGASLPQAVARARDLLLRSLASGAGVRWGPGPGPAFAGPS